MNLRKDKIYTIFLLILCLCLTPSLNTDFVNGDEEIEYFFSISLLAANTCSARNQWATLMVEQLPKIGIGIDVFDHTGWAQIVPRTWAYPGPYPIPTYNESGYDILFVGWTWGLDWDPTGLYDSSSITPNGDNFYQYSSPEMDWAISNYNSSISLEDRDFWGNQIQAILYEDCPSITAYYSKCLLAMDEDLYGYNGLLWTNSFQTMANWTINGQSEFRYATPYDFQDFHIYKCESSIDSSWLHQIYSGLISRSDYPADNNNYIPHLASNITTTDGMNYTISLNPNVKFADGVTLNASDVKYSYELFANPEFAAPNYPFWSNYLYNHSVTILDEFKIKISFKQPYIFQDTNLALPILPKHIWSEIDPANHVAQATLWVENNPSKILGTGPYRLEEYDSDNGIIHLVRNNYYQDWNDLSPFFNDIFFEFYSSKEAALYDLQYEVIDMIDSQFFVQIDEVPTSNCKYELIDDSGLQEMAINNLHPYIGTGEFCPISSSESGKHLRKAISYMVPREMVISETLYGFGRPGVTACPSTATIFNETLEPLEYSIELAKAEMELAGFIYPTTRIISFGYSLPVLICIISLIGGFITHIGRNKKKL